MRKIAAFAALCALVLVLFPKQFDAQTPASSQQSQIENGKKQFEQLCGFCHGPDATGARGPDLVRSALVAHDVKGDLIGEVVRSGRPEKGMPPLPATQEQIADIAVFLHARAKEAVDSSGVPASYPVQRLLTGDASKGRAFFESTGGCTTCHSPTGDLAGVARKYSSIELEAHMLYPQEKTVAATVTLGSGEQLTGVLSHIDDFIVAIRVGGKDGWYRSFPRDRVKVELKDPLSAHRELLPKLTQAEMHDLFAYINTLK